MSISFVDKPKILVAILTTETESMVPTCMWTYKGKTNYFIPNS